jgi:hypothetical protein
VAEALELAVLPDLVEEDLELVEESDAVVDLRVTLEETVEAELLFVSVVTATDVVLVVATEDVEVESEAEVEETDELELEELDEAEVLAAALPPVARARPVLSARKEE